METRISNTDAHNAFYLITFLSLLKHTYFFFFFLMKDTFLKSMLKGPLKISLYKSVGAGHT